MKHIILLAFIFCSTTALPVREDDDGSDDTTGFSYLGPEECEIMTNETNVSSPWQTNPEERGPYVEGDIMIADGFGSVGFNIKSFRWPNATIPYTYEKNYNSEQINMIIEAMTAIEMWTCIKFVPYSGQMDYIAIRNINNTSCSSFIGHIGGRQVVYLEAPLCFTKIGTVLHELLHTIGLLHEHNRPDRDQYITINKCNTKTGNWEYFKKYIETNDFRIPYNYNSIMHYSEYAWSKNGLKTIEPKVDNGFPIGQRYGLSVRDVIGVNKLYTCNITEDNVTRPEFGLPNFHESLLSEEANISLNIVTTTPTSVSLIENSFTYNPFYPPSVYRIPIRPFFLVFTKFHKFTSPHQVTKP